MAVNFDTIFFLPNLTMLNKFTKLLKKFPFIFFGGKRGVHELNCSKIFTDHGLSVTGAERKYLLSLSLRSDTPSQWSGLRQSRSGYNGD